MEDGFQGTLNVITQALGTTILPHLRVSAESWQNVV
jgi:hypothetical protein